MFPIWIVVGRHYRFLVDNVNVNVKLLSRARLFVTLWTVAYQAPPPMGFSRQEYWSGVPLPSPLFIPRDPRDPENYCAEHSRLSKSLQHECDQER